MNYSDFNLHLNTDVKSFEVYPNTVINVLQYLPIEDKYDLIQIALQNSEENGVYSLIKLNMYFKLYIVYLYTDIEFTEEEKDNPAKLYDELESMGIIDAVINAINPNEYQYLREVLDVTMDQKLKYRNTVASVINNFIENLVPNTEQAGEIIKNFNPEDFQHAFDFFKAINNGQLPR